MTDLSKIRNFSIIAHIDHGKSTLADRLIQHCGGLTDREMSEQVLDNMDIEKERGITIKAQTVRLNYTARDGETYELNLMDTPGHVDFAYEVSRSLAACEGALLVVDAAQGVEAQTLANVYQSIEHDHEIVPVINKIDLPAAEPERVAEEIEEIVGIEATGAWEEGGAVLTSAKSGIGIEDTLEALVRRIPAPTGDRDAPLKAMLVDSWYDPYLGVVILVRVMDGVIKKGLNVKFMQGGTQHLIDRVGCFKYSPVDGAQANDLPGAVPDGVKQERYDALMRLQAGISARRLREKRGQTIEVLVDEADDDGAIARSAGDAPEIDGLVYLEGARLQPGQRLQARVTDSDEHDLWAEVIASASR